MNSQLLGNTPGPELKSTNDLSTDYVTWRLASKDWFYIIHLHHIFYYCTINYTQTVHFIFCHNPSKQKTLRYLRSNIKIMRQSDRATEWKWPCCCLEQTNISSAYAQGTPASQLHSASHICQRLCASSLRGGVRGGKEGRKKGRERHKERKKNNKASCGFTQRLGCISRKL